MKNFALSLQKKIQKSVDNLHKQMLLNAEDNA